MRRGHLVRALVLLGVVALIPACGGSSGGGGGGGGGGGTPTPPPISVAETEPNNSSTTANALPIGSVGTGDLLAIGDVDFWSVTTTSANTALRIECFGHRRDQATWIAAANSPRVTVFDLDGSVLYNDPLFFGGDPDLPGIFLATVGTYVIRVRQATATLVGGRYALRVTSITTTQVEAEPIGFGATANDTFATAEALTGSSGTLLGFRESPTVDVYSVVIPANSLLDVSTIAFLNGGQPTGNYDIEVHLLATDGTTLIGDYDDGRAGFDVKALRGYVTAGTYFIRVQNSASGAGNSGRYIMQWSVTAFGPTETEPNDTAPGNPIVYGDVVSGALSAGTDIDLFAFTGAAGDQLILEAVDGVGTGALPRLEGATAAVTPRFTAADGTTLLTQDTFTGTTFDNANTAVTILQSSGTFHVSITGAAATTYAFRLTRVRTSTVEVEANDTFGTANALVSTGTSGVIGVAADVDFYSFTALAGEVVVLRLVGEKPAGTISEVYDGHGSNLTPLLTVLDTDGTTVITTSTHATATRRAQGLRDVQVTVEIAFRAAAAGTYFLSVASTSGAAGGADQYYLVYRD